ncbi:voltage-dependent anion channel [Aspergillus karnatakaensis]|uniref:tellurite-resistance/dicarboxylate transporter family protein n=1 Tax=Aspergillus karnatakaensis TaxID=1810916 RepID=UPI003CCD00D1
MDIESKSKPNPRRTSLRDRITAIKWGYFSISMATGGIAVLLYNTPHQFTGLETIGKIVYIFNLVLFLLTSILITIRFSFPGELKESFNHPNETHFVGTCPLALATIIMGASVYGTPACGLWLIVALRVVFWIYVAIAILQAVFHNWHLYNNHMASEQPFAIVRLLPSFPAMLGGTIASVLASDQPQKHALNIIVGGLTLQGFGITMCLFVYAEYFYRMNKSGLPKKEERLEMFIAVGPWSFTALALIGMANAAVEKFPDTYFLTSAIEGSQVVVSAGQIALVLASLVAIFLWLLAFFCFCIALISVLSVAKIFGGEGRVHTSLPYWSMVFPNTGFVIATVRIGTVLESEAVLWVSSVMTVIQVAAWLGVGIASVRKFLKGEML